jgi:lysozyme family protein
VAYALAANGIRPVFGTTDTQRFLWARAWVRYGAPLVQPKPGCVMVFAREAGGHVALYEGEDATSYRVRGGNQSNAVNVTTMPKSAFLAAVWPDVAGEARPVADNFARVHPVIAEWEGGYSNHPRDSGGPTNWGITQATLSAHRGRQVSAQEVQALTYEEALTIFRARYWQPLRCDELPLALALMTYNTGVNSGPSRGARFLQQTLNLQGFDLDEDGEIGELTIAAANACEDIARAVNDYSAIYERFYRSLSNFNVFGRGWLNRLNDVTAQALAWSDDEPTKPVPVEPVPGDGSSLVPDPAVIGAIIAAATPLLIQYGPYLLRLLAALAAAAPAVKPDTSKPWWKFLKKEQ